MTVEQLIRLLEKEDPNMKVVTRGYEMGVNNINNVRLLEVREVHNPPDYEGKYSRADKEPWRGMSEDKTTWKPGSKPIEVLFIGHKKDNIYI